MLQRALANGKRAGGGAATSVRVAARLSTIYAAPRVARGRFREIPLALVADTRPTPSSTQKKREARPKKDGPVRTQRCVARARPAPRRRVPAPARPPARQLFPAHPKPSARRAPSRGPPHPPASATPALFSNAPEPGGDFDALVGGSGAADPDAFPLARAAPPPASAAVSVADPVSFDPDDDPVVCRMVHNAQAQAARSGGARQGGTGGGCRARGGGATNPRRSEPPTPAEARRAVQGADLEQRLNAKRKFAELECSIERVSLRRWWSARRFAIV